MSDLVSGAALLALGQVVLIDLVLAGDNAIVVAALAAGLPPADRRRVILLGTGAALVLRVGFALIVQRLLGVTGLVLAGGVLLLWVAWRMWRDLRRPVRGTSGGVTSAKSFARAAWQVALADVSMSLDNVLAVAGAARDNPTVMVIGLVLSVVLMGVAANLLARVIERVRWVAYLGLAVLVYVAGAMMWDGARQVAPALGIA